MSQRSPPRLLSPIQLVTKRRAKPSRRRQPLSRVDCQPDAHPFDSLPWISALDAPPDSLSPWDIADLSQIQFPFPPSGPGPGPVRRRKSSLRSNPLALPPAPTPDDSSWAAGSTLPFCDTPPSRFTPSRVLFHNLMPVNIDQPDACTFTRPLSR